MLMLYLYAIIDRPGDGLTPVVGLADQPTYCCPDGDIGAVVSYVDLPFAEIMAAHIWRHERVVETLAAQRSVLPVRFGTLLADEAAVQSLLRERHDSFVSDLNRLRGQVEMSLRVLWSKLQPLSPVPFAEASFRGRAFSKRRIATLQADALYHLRAEQLADSLHAHFDRYAIASVCKVLPTARTLLSAAYLVTRQSAESFRAKIDQVSKEHPDLRLLCTGPWPAYHFVVPS